MSHHIVKVGSFLIVKYEENEEEIAQVLDVITVEAGRNKEDSEQMHILNCKIPTFVRKDKTGKCEIYRRDGGYIAIGLNSLGWKVTS